MKHLHTKLTQKYPKYHNWHQTKHHNKAHWGVFVVFSFVLFSLILNVVSAYDAAGNESGKSTSTSATTQQSGIIFEDNFNDHPDWTRLQPKKEENNDVCYSGSCDVPSGWDGYYNGSSRCPGGPGHNTLNLNSEQPRGDTGKSLILWQESCTNTFGDSDGQLTKIFDKDYTELYIQFFIKFSPAYQWVQSGMGPHKIVRAWHYRGWGTPYQFFGNGNEPGWGGNLKSYNGSSLWYYTAYRCEKDYYCQGTPLYQFDVGYDQDHLNMGDIKTSLVDGNWHNWEEHIRLNTYSEASQTFNADGVHRFWLDGQLIYESFNIPFGDNGSQVSPRKGFNYVSFGGNNNNRWTTNCTGTECEQWYAIDDIVISTTYIGPDDSPPDDSPPTSPQNLTATPISSTQINLSWSASIDDVGVAGYKIYRNGVLLTTNPSPLTPRH